MTQIKVGVRNSERPPQLVVTRAFSMGLADLVKQAREEQQDDAPPTMGENAADSSAAPGKPFCPVKSWSKVRIAVKLRLNSNNKIVSDKRDHIVDELPLASKIAVLCVYMAHNFWNCWVNEPSPRITAHHR